MLVVPAFSALWLVLDDLADWLRLEGFAPIALKIIVSSIHQFEDFEGLTSPSTRLYTTLSLLSLRFDGATFFVATGTFDTLIVGTSITLSSSSSSPSLNTSIAGVVALDVVRS